MSDVTPGLLDSYALRRRVLLTGVVAIVLWLAATYSIFQLGVSDAWVLVALFLIYLLAIRPLMRPVREAIKLRHRLAYESYLDEKRHQGDA